MRPTKLRRFGPALAGAVVAFSLAPAAEAQQGSVLAPVAPGRTFPTGVYENMNAATGGPASIDLAEVLGKKPVLLVYWIPENTRAEKVLQEVQSLVGELGSDRVALYGVAVPRPTISVELIQERIQALGITVPVLQDEGFKIGQMLRVTSVPNVTLIDRDGAMRLTRGASLSQVLGYEVDLEKAIRKIVSTGDLMTYGYLDTYYPVEELKGKPCPDFKAPLLTTMVEQRYHNLLDPEKLNILIFWSVDCPHCRRYLPQINEWLKQHPEDINVISAAGIRSDAGKSKTLEFCRLNDFQFPTLMDKDAEIGKLYNVTATPTILFIGPDGIIDSAIISDYVNFGKTVERKKRELLKPSGTSG